MTIRKILTSPLAHAVARRLAKKAAAQPLADLYASPVGAALEAFAARRTLALVERRELDAEDAEAVADAWCAWGVSPEDDGAA
jgi:hypothetical protein